MYRRCYNALLENLNLKISDSRIFIICTSGCMLGAVQNICLKQVQDKRRWSGKEACRLTEHCPRISCDECLGIQPERSFIMFGLLSPVTCTQKCK